MEKLLDLSLYLYYNRILSHITLISILYVVEDSKDPPGKKNPGP